LNELCFDLEFEFEGHGRVDSSAVLEVQHKLNQVPHGKREPAMAHQAIALLFADACAQ
jgi:hypothetical protein